MVDISWLTLSQVKKFSQASGSEILGHIYSQGNEQFKKWITNSFITWIVSKFVSMVWITKEIPCNNSIGKALDWHLSKNVYIHEQVSSSGMVVPKTFSDKKLLHLLQNEIQEKIVMKIVMM